MKLLMIHVGNPVRGVPVLPNEHYFKRYSFEYDSEQTYLKKDIVNADSQMQSLIQLNIAVSYGYFGSRKNPITLFRTGKLIRMKKWRRKRRKNLRRNSKIQILKN